MGNFLRRRFSFAVISIDPEGDDPIESKQFTKLNPKRIVSIANANQDQNRMAF